MKFLLKVTMPVENGNAAIRGGAMSEKVKRIVSETKPEAVYFAVENGQRSQYLILNVDDAKQMPSIVEPWWLLFNADVSISPVFTIQDMEAMGPALEDVAKKWAKAKGN